MQNRGARQAGPPARPEVSGERGERGELVKGAATQQALELVALRGRDVIGVRHILDGQAHVGTDPASIARVVKGDVVAEVTGDRYALKVPAGARARVHQADGLARLLTGPTEVCLGERDRAVLVLGAIQIRAQIVPVEIVSKAGVFSPRWARAASSDVPGLARWIGLVGALYAVALVICVLLAPRESAQLESGAVRKAVAAAQATALVLANEPVMEGVEGRASPQLDLDGEAGRLGTR